MVQSECNRGLQQILSDMGKGEEETILFLILRESMEIKYCI